MATILTEREVCPCGAEHTEGANYYVSVVDPDNTKRVGLLAGPYSTHPEALGMVTVVRAVAERLNPWAAFYSFGTLAMSSDYTEPGKLMDKLPAEAR